MLFVWTSGDPVAANARGSPVCLVYAEDSVWLDGGSLSRYRLMSDQWPIDHGSCVVSILEVVGIVRSLGILVVGGSVPAHILREMEAGHIFVPQARERMGRLWYPEDMAFGGSYGEHGRTCGPGHQRLLTKGSSRERHR